MQRKKSIDAVITTLFLIVWSYYAVMGIVFSRLSKENYVPYVLITITGLILIWVSSMMKSAKSLAWPRFLGLVLVHPLIYFDIKVNGGFEEPLELVKYMSLGYSPVIVYVIFSIYHVLKLSNVNRPKAANIGLPK